MVYGQTTPEDGSEKQPNYYVDSLRSLSAAITMKSNGFMELMARKIHGGISPTTQLKEILAELRVQCSCQPISWLTQYLNLGGVNALLSVLVMIQKKAERYIFFAIMSYSSNDPFRKQKYHDIEAEALKILRTIANSHVRIYLTSDMCFAIYSFA